MSIVMYSKPGCQACNATKRHFNRLGIAFEEINIVTDHHAAQRLRELRSLELPRVEVSCYDYRESWTGYRPTKIEALHQRISA